MTVLGLETSTAVCSVAVASDEGWRVERSVVEEHIHSEQLLTLVNGVLSEAKIALQDLHAVAVSCGPGSFTGLRIGMSSAKGLCYALEKPFVAIPTFEAIAHRVAALGDTPPLLVIALDAKRNDFYVAVYRLNEGRMTVEREVAVLPEATLVRLVGSTADALIVTDRPDRLSGLAAPALSFRLLTEVCNATSVAELGLKKTLAKEFTDLAAAEPMYLKEFAVRAQPNLVTFPTSHIS
jgi:tRNA threonylcarbamoyladenosine biosynthesis protein TsaB